MTKTASQKAYVILSVPLCALTMCVIDGIIQPGYAIKSLIKAAMFLLVPLGYFLMNRDMLPQLRKLLHPRKTGLLWAALIALAVYGLMVGGYYVLKLFIDIDGIALRLTADGGVRADNFVFVSLYISLVNSLLEEFFFRGFAFIALKNLVSKRYAYLFSAAAFAGYHFGMLAGSGNIGIWILAMAGLFLAGCILNFLSEKDGSIYPSWLVHMFANLGINTIGFIVFGMI